MRVRPNSSNGNQKVATVSINEPKKRVHNVFIVDASGSMRGGKYDNAISGLNELLKSIKSDQFTDNTVTIVEFEGTTISNRLFTETKIPDSYKEMGTGGMTPLNTAVGQTIEQLLNARKNSFNVEDKVLINVFTDGEENSSWGKYADPSTLSELIKSVESQGFTVTFQGTKNEVNYAINKLNLKSSNTNVHDNTVKGIKSSFERTANARVMYSKSVSRGEDVTAQFYSKTIEPSK